MRYKNRVFGSIILLSPLVGMADMGDLLISDKNVSYVGHVFFASSQDHEIFIKPPPANGHLRIVNDQGVYLESRQFSFDTETSLFGWMKKKIYYTLLPVTLKRYADIEVYRIASMGVNAGLQQATVILYDKNVFNMPIMIDCKHGWYSYTGVGSCKQTSGSTFTVRAINTSNETMNIGVVHGDDEAYPLTIKAKESADINVKVDGESLLIANDQTQAMIYSIEESPLAELPRPELFNDGIQIGIGPTLVQCGKFHFPKNASSILTIPKACNNEHIYQWADDGRFLWTSPEELKK